MTDAGDPPIAALGDKTWHRFLSPHYDDVALCCGGTAALLAQAGLAPQVVVVFAEGPDPAQPLTPFAALQHAAWGLHADEVVARRRREETLAAEIIGTTVSFLPFRDAIYRGERYLSDADLFADPAPDERALPGEILAALGPDSAPDPKARVYAPLAIGGHVDHRHVFAVGTELARAGWEVWFYEDVPYALREGAVETRLGELPMPFAEAAVVDVKATWDAKVAAVLAYASQLPRVFGWVGGDGSGEDVARRLRVYAEHVGGGAPAERFWRMRLTA